MFSETAKRRSLGFAVLLAAILILALLIPALRVSAGEPETEIENLSFQTVKTDNVESGETDLRFLFTVGSLDYTRVGFVFSKTNANPTEGGDGCTVRATNVVYSTVIADGETVAAPNGRYWAAIKITGIENGYFDTPIYVNAFVEDGEGVRYATATRITVCEAFGNESNAAAFVPILRFAVFSDAHYGESVNAQDQKLHDLIEGAYDYSDNHAKYQTLDGVFAVGDIADRGTLTELNRFFTDFYTYIRPGTAAQAVLGNHEFYSEPANTVSRYLTASGYDSADRHITIS
ncbi:MAG: metallophosphoesterase, partial [Clostridia bacterium]|nr:metallophosphoesterase [Clostridia bacterium]